MKSLIWEQYGGPDQLQVGARERPRPTGDQLLVRIHASSINSWDWELLRGVPFANRLGFGLTRPKVILGADVAGTVEAVGPQVSAFMPGDAVYGDLSASGWGGFAEFVAVSQSALRAKPANLSFEQAAAVPQAGLLAYQGLIEKDHLRQGMRVLINGASGGAGSFALQLAKLHGAEVTGVCRGEKLAFVHSLGADHLLDYREADFTRNGQQYDLILDLMGHHSLFDYQRALAPGGRYLMVGGASSRIFQVLTLGPLLSLLSQKRLGLLLHKANRGLDELSALLERGGVVPVVDRVFSLDEVQQAMRYYAEGRTRGKVVIRIGR